MFWTSPQLEEMTLLRTPSWRQGLPPTLALALASGAFPWRPPASALFCLPAGGPVQSLITSQGLLIIHSIKSKFLCLTFKAVCNLSSLFMNLKI